MTYILAFLAGMFLEAAGTLAEKGRKGEAVSVLLVSVFIIISLVFII